MPDEEKQDHWKLLATDLGAEALQEPQPTARPSSEEGLPRGAAPPRAKSKVKPKDKSSTSAKRASAGGDWGSLAKQLGIDASEPTPATVPAEPARPTRTRAVASQVTPVTPVASFAADVEPIVASSVERTAEVEIGETAGSSFGVEADVEADVDKSKKLPRKRKRRGRRSRDKKSSPEASAAEMPEAATLSVEDVDTVSDESQADSEADTEAAPTEGRKPAEKSGRGRRGRGRRKKSSPRQATDESADVAGRRDMVKGEASSTPAEGRRASSNDVENELDAEDESEIDLAHRGIPSWKDAVGMVIEANLTTRSRRGSGESSTRPRGNRGRRGKGRNDATSNRSS